MDTAISTPEIRIGSPFYGDSVFVDPPPSIDAAASGFDSRQTPQEIGQARYLAWGGVVAGIVVLPQSALASVYFPVGGIMVAGLGCVLAVIGLSSPRPRMAALILVVHLSAMLYSATRL